MTLANQGTKAIQKYFKDKREIASHEEKAGGGGKSVNQSQYSGKSKKTALKSEQEKPNLGDSQHYSGDENDMGMDLEDKKDGEEKKDGKEEPYQEKEADTEEFERLKNRKIQHLSNKSFAK